MRSLLAGFVLALSLAACGDSTSASDIGNDTLSSEEAAALAEILVGQSVQSGLSEALEPAQSPGTTPAKTPFTIDAEVMADVPCPLGGSVFADGSIQGSGDDETGDFSVSFSLVQEHRACRVRDDGTGVEFTLDGDPNVSFQFDMMVANETDFDFLGTMAGRVGWNTDDGRSGSCGIDLDFSVTASGLAERGSSYVEGQVCGVQLSESVSVM